MGKSRVCCTLYIFKWSSGVRIVWKGMRQPLVTSCLGNPYLLIHLPNINTAGLCRFLCQTGSLCQLQLIFFAFDLSPPTPPWSTLLGILDRPKSRPSYFSALCLTLPVCRYRHISVCACHLTSFQCPFSVFYFHYVSLTCHLLMERLK